MDNRDTTTGALSRQSQGDLSRSASRYNPLHEMQEQMRRMDALFNRAFGYEPFPSSLRMQFQQLQQSEPDVDIYESDTEYVLHCALPGIDPQDIQLETTEDSIILSAQRRAPFNTTGNDGQGNQVNQNGQTNQGGQGAQNSQTNQQAGQSANLNANVPHTQHRQSRYSGQTRFRFVYTLPTSINPDEVRATFRNGMLELHLPKQQRPAARTVPINVETVGSNASASNAIGGMTGQINGQPTAQTQGAGQVPGGKMDAEHEPGRQNASVSSGQTNPMGTAPATPQETPTEANRR